MRHLIPISGKDSLTTAIVQKIHHPELDYEFFYNYVGAEPPEIFDWLSSVEIYLGQEIVFVGANLTNVIYSQGILPSVQARFCTRIAKIEAMQNYIGTEEVSIYYGIRYDETARIGYSPRKNELAKYPLIEHKIDIRGVYAILSTLGLQPPSFFWRSMFRIVEQLLGEDAFLLKSIPKQLLNIWFAWRSRPNCTYCFNQRQYEFIGLWEHHPKYFWQAVKMEEELGGKNYTWQKGHSLLDLLDNATQIKKRRARQIVKMIYAFQQKSFLEESPDLLVGTSCGLFCGK